LSFKRLICNTHFIATAGAVKIKAYGDPNEVGQLPYSGLSLSAAAVIIAFEYQKL
jgi:hypothetical protein